MYRARQSIGSDSWIVEKEFPCINGLNTWFTIVFIEEATDQELGYTEGAFPSAKDRAKLIAAKLNT